MRTKLALNKRALKSLSGMQGNPHVPFLGGDIAAMLCLYPTPQFCGVLALTPGNPRRTEKLLSLQPVEEIWGVGHRISKKLNTMGITTALQLARTNPTFIRKNFNVVLERTVRELNGESCISLEEAPSPKQQIVCSRSFGERVTTYEAMR